MLVPNFLNNFPVALTKLYSQDFYTNWVSQNYESYISEIMPVVIGKISFR